MTQEVLDQLNNLNLDHLTKKIVQDQEKENKGKYKHILKTTDQNGIEYSVTEYVCPNGEVGFDIFFYRNIEGIEYIKTICYGQELVSRQREWTKVINSSI